MKRSFFTFIIVFQATLGFSQFIDNFSDGDFNLNPVWTGNTSAFEIDSLKQLHLKDTIANTSYLTTESKAISNAIWEFNIRLDFNPSTSNYARVYLAADNNNLTTSLNGVFVRIGGESGTIDAISLFVQHGSTSTKIIDGIDGLAATNPDLKIKVTRDNIGNWELFVDTSNQYMLQGAAFESSITTSNYFGVYCKYTVTRADKFWFDNFTVNGDSLVLPTPQQTNANDVIINEIFIDPSPSIGLPETEYIELYNRTDTAINLADWTITIGSAVKLFPTAIIESDSFILLVKESALDSFPNTIAKIGLSSIALTNTSGNIILKNKSNRTIDAISYTQNWYQDNNKKEGGWSIERINPNLFCETHNNWSASISGIGGTPGKQNSVIGESVYIAPFRIAKAYPLDSNKFIVYFNKKVDSTLLTNPENFNLNTGNVISSTALSPYFSAVILNTDFNFLRNTTYEVFAEGINDCSGNSTSNSLNFGIADTVLANDIIINELLFNPKDNGVDYIELYNNSTSFFDLSKLRTGNFFEFGGALNPENIKEITTEKYLFAPQTYLVLTTDSAKVKAQYYCKNPYAFIEVKSLPTLANEEGNICILHQSLNQIIDAFAYNEAMHFSLLNDVDGVALERLNTNDITQKEDNWHSAASTVNYGTPTYKNSQQYINESIGKLTLSPKVISPNNDGYHDVLNINWNFNLSGLKATLKIFDAEGRLKNTLINNQLIGNNGSINWDGTSEEGQQLNTGMYIVFMQVFSKDGRVESYKKVVVLQL